jgi:hypothetical protein
MMPFIDSKGIGNYFDSGGARLVARTQSFISCGRFIKVITSYLHTMSTFLRPWPSGQKQGRHLHIHFEILNCLQGGSMYALMRSTELFELEC